jgi:hypothetical protein
VSSSVPPCNMMPSTLCRLSITTSMELFTSTVVWEPDDKITIYDKTQGTQNCQSYVAGVFGLS